MTEMNENPVQIALVQMTAGHDPLKNAKFLEEAINSAAKGGAHYVQTPENSLLMELDRARVADIISSNEYKSLLEGLFKQAGELGIWLHLGSVALLFDNDAAHQQSGPRFANRSLLINPQGQLAEFYDKIHMFDVTLPNGEVYHESANYKPGERAVVAESDFARIGLSICYDLRFPALYRHLAQAGAEMMSVPAAFTQTTGKPHWHVLLRARAIETGSFIVASGQTGTHDNGRATYGHSLIVAPWGDVVLDAGEDVGVFSAAINLQDVAKARSTMPSLSHDRKWP